MSTTYAHRQTTAQARPASNAAVVNDSRSLSAAQRVIQRAGDVVQKLPADRKFVYYHNIGGVTYKDRIPYEPGKICFTPYANAEIKSANFSGCFMVAFHFVESKFPAWDDAESFNKIPPIFFSEVPRDFSQTFIAHVATGDLGDAKEALFDAENRGLIEIEAMFKPFRNVTDDEYLSKGKIHQNQNLISPGAAGIRSVTGSLNKDAKGKWSAKVYTQERILDFYRSYNDGFVGDNGQTLAPYIGGFADFLKDHPEYYHWLNIEREERRMDAKRMEFETFATKALLYASIAADANIDRSQKDIALQKLKDIRKKRPKALTYASKTLSGSNKRAKIMLNTIYKHSKTKLDAIVLPD